MSEIIEETEIAIPRHVPENPYNYTNLQLAERKKALRDLERDYPNLPFGWLEMIYDFEKNTPKEEVEDIINKGRWEVPGKYSELTFENVNVNVNGNENENGNKKIVNE